MCSFMKVVAAVAWLTTTAFAFPSTSLAALVERQSDTDCSAETVFYSCANGYRGCFTSDPCALPPAQSAMRTPTVPLTTPTSVSHACAVSINTPATYYEPEMYNLWVGDPNCSQTEPVSYISIWANDETNQEQQAVVFRNIPADARSCSLRWYQANASERIFNVTDNGSVTVTQLSSFPAAGNAISVNSISALKSNNHFTVDFTGWDLVFQASDHVSGGVFDCAEELYFQIEINLPNSPTKWGKVFMEQDIQNGFYLSYMC